MLANKNQLLNQFVINDQAEGQWYQGERLQQQMQP